MHDTIAVYRDGSWFRAAAFPPGRRIWIAKGERVDVSARVLAHLTADLELSRVLAPRLAAGPFGVVPHGGIPVAHSAADLLRWVVRQLREEQR